MPSLKDAVVGRLDGLIEVGRRAAGSYQLTEMGGQESSLSEEDLRAFLTGAAAAIEQVAGRESEFFKRVPRLANDYHNLVLVPQVTAGALGALLALRKAVEGGHLSSLESSVRANVEDDFLDQAATLLEAGYRVAAMVLAGGVLEDRLRTMCKVRGLQLPGDGSLAKYNSALYKAQVYDKPLMHRIESITALRNAAAHGGVEAEGITREDVDDAVKRLRRFLADYA